MKESITRKKDSLKSPFRGMLIFVAVLFILAMLIYRSKPSATAVNAGRSDTTHNSHDSLHPE